jgi:hypothetical protein
VKSQQLEADEIVTVGDALRNASLLDASSGDEIIHCPSAILVAGVRDLEPGESQRACNEKTVVRSGLRQLFTIRFLAQHWGC